MAYKQTNNPYIKKNFSITFSCTRTYRPKLDDKFKATELQMKENAKILTDPSITK